MLHTITTSGVTLLVVGWLDVPETVLPVRQAMEPEEERRRWDALVAQEEEQCETRSE